MAAPENRERRTENGTPLRGDGWAFFREDAKGRKRRGGGRKMAPGLGPGPVVEVG